MLFSVPTDRCSTSSAGQAGSCSANFSRRTSLFTIKNLVGCGYVGNTDVIHIPPAWACGPWVTGMLSIKSTGQHYGAGPFSTHRFLGRPIFLLDSID